MTRKLDVDIIVEAVRCKAWSTVHLDLYGYPKLASLADAEEEQFAEVPLQHRARVGHIRPMSVLSPILDNCQPYGGVESRHLSHREQINVMYRDE